jgi:hypothetical protein
MNLSQTLHARARISQGDLTLAWAACTCALLDGLTTLISLSQGGVEVNPLIGPQPGTMLLAVLSVGKMLAVRASLVTPRMFRRPFLAGAVVVWGGVSVNNLLVATPWPDPLPVVGGALAALCLLAWAARSTLRVSPSAAS